MKMTDLIDAVVECTGLGRAEAGRAVAAMLDALPGSRRRNGIEPGRPGTAGAEGRTGTLRLGVDELTVEAIHGCARRLVDCGIEVPAEARGRMERSNALKHELIRTRQPIYGVTTGFGDSVDRQISTDKAVALQANLIRYHLAGSGAEAEAAVVRATMLIRANCLARGYSGVRPEVVALLVACLQADILPVVPERGSVGASGDLIPLSYMAQMLTGCGEVHWRDRRMEAAAALQAGGLAPLILEAKEGLALINGTSFMSAYAALACRDARGLAAVSDLCTALCVEALAGNSGPFDPFIHRQKPHPGQSRSAARIAGLLEGSGLALGHSEIVDASRPLGNQGFVRHDRPIQDRYSVRCAPHVTGVLYDTLDWAEDWIETEVNSTNDNPVFDPVSRSVLSGGNFYGGHVGLAMDALKVALASVGDLLDRQMALVVDEKFNAGLTPNLIARRADDDDEAGLHHGFKGMQLACSALAAEALKMSGPATIFSRSTEAHNQDKVSMGTIAARDARSVVELVETICAIHLLALCQAADLRGAERLGRGTAAAYRLVRAVSPFVGHDRRLDGDVAAVLALIRSGAFETLVADGAA